MQNKLSSSPPNPLSINGEGEISSPSLRGQGGGSDKTTNKIIPKG